jgi:hypothetical protein
MTEQIFRSPNFYEREIDLSVPAQGEPVGVPAGVIGPSSKGPAFIPVTVANFNEFIEKFGNLDTKYFGPYAVNEFLKNRSALTYLRVLGAGANSTLSHISDTLAKGTVLNAGFSLSGVNATEFSPGRHTQVVQFISAEHDIQSNEQYGMPMFSDNDTFPGASTVNLVRGLVMVPTGSRVMAVNGTQDVTAVFSNTMDDEAVAQNVNGKPVFKLIISSSLGASFASDDGLPGLLIYTASFDPSSENYFGKLMNTDPDKFYSSQHYLAADFAVDEQVAKVADSNYVAILSGSSNTSVASGDSALPFRSMFGAYNTRFTAPQTSWFISQPFGKTEFDLFKFEAMDDGEYANSLYKISIANIKASPDVTDGFGTFNVQIRNWDDTDINSVVIEEFTNCNLNPDSDNYIGKLIGDRKLYYNFDAVDPRERRLVANGTYQNRSKYVRVIVSDLVKNKKVPVNALPFGFHGPSLLKTNDNIVATSALALNTGRLSSVTATSLTASVIPPVPYRYKVTRGEIAQSLIPGAPGPKEVALPSLYWGVKFERNALTDANEVLNNNVITEKNPLVKSMTRFMGIEKLDALLTGSGADSFNSNKFTLAKVAFGNSSVSDVTGSTGEHMKETAYLRNGNPDPTNYTINDGYTNRITFASLLSAATSSAGAANFNRFSTYAKFTTFMYGGFDGVNYLDRDARRLNDKSTSFEADALALGGASSNFVPGGFGTSVPSGVGKENNGVASYLTAVDIMTDPLGVGLNILTIPGIREAYVMEQTSKKVKDYGLAIHLMDIPSYDDDGNRLYDDSTTKPNIKKTTSTFDARGIDNNYVATYFPDVFIDDSANARRVKVPATVAALGALGFNDRVSYPWFAPAGFNRASLDFVTNVGVRLNVGDRDRLYDSRINPIATFPRLGFVIYGQKTLQVKKSALDRVNVRRLLLEIKRIIIGIANRIVFEQNTPAVRNRFVSEAVFQLGLIQTQAGVEAFQVVMNETNNTQADIDLNKLNGRVVVVPTRAIEYIAIDFIVTNAGVQFV